MKISKSPVLGMTLEEVQGLRERCSPSKLSGADEAWTIATCYIPKLCKYIEATLEKERSHVRKEIH